MSDEATVEAYQDLAHQLVKPLIGEGTYKLKARVKDGKVEILVDADPQVRGRLIGRGGRIARSLRTILQSSGIQAEHQVSFDIVD